MRQPASRVGAGELSGADAQRPAQAQRSEGVVDLAAAALATAQARLTVAKFQRCRAEGEELSLDAATALALKSLRAATSAAASVTHPDF